MEKLATPAMIAAIQGNSTPVDPNAPARGAAGGAQSVTRLHAMPVRLATPSPDRRHAVPPVPARHEYADLMRGVATALSALAAHERALARAMELGDIDLPPGAPNAQDRAQLQAAAPLYFASELEAAGLLPTAELVAGLFASGAITQPLGPAAQLLHTFWRHRRERLDAKERDADLRARDRGAALRATDGQPMRALVAPKRDGSDLRESRRSRPPRLRSANSWPSASTPWRRSRRTTLSRRSMPPLAFLRDRLSADAPSG